ncbi:glycosyl hydrolase family 28-related protein [Saccharobesus litoralis]|nr:glycosyl hydrolase family 28-related protein [Saccharobesus litoralis]
MINRNDKLRGVNKRIIKNTSIVRKGLAISASAFALVVGQAYAADLAKPSTYSDHSSAWQGNYANAYDGNNGNEARANSRGTASDVWLEFDFASQHTNFDITFLEDNSYPYAVSRWKVQGWQNGQWTDLPSGWQAHNSTDLDPAYPIDSSYRTDKMRVLFQAGSGNEVGLNELNIAGDPVSSTVELATTANLTDLTPAWWSNHVNVLDDVDTNIGQSSAREVYMEFDFGATYSNFDISFLEDNVYPYAVSRWKIQGWQNGAWQDIAGWQAHNSTSFAPVYPIASNYATDKMRVYFQASTDERVGVNELNIIGTPQGAGGSGPTPIVDSQFYTEPTQSSGTFNLVNDYGVNNSDTSDDTALLQQALDEISALPQGGKLFIPAGDYYLLDVKLRSNVHLDIASGATIYPTWNGDGRNHRIFELGTVRDGVTEPKVENFSLIGRNNGFVVDFTQSNDPNLAVFNMGDMQNFKISNIRIKDKKTIFASFLVGVTRKGNNLYWPKDGIIEKITQTDALFGYGVIQTYGADNILFRDLDGEGGITLRMETDNLVMKDLKQGGIRNIYAENIKCTDGLAAVMFGPHFMQNGAVQVNGVEANGCGFAVRVDTGYVELFSPANETHTRDSWKAAVNAELGSGCAATPYARGNGGTRWAARINDVGNCLTNVYNNYGLKPGTFETSDIYNVNATFGTDAHLKQDQLDYFELSNPTCDNVCLPTTSQWSKQGQIYLGPSLGGVIDKTVDGKSYDFDVNIHNLNMSGYPTPSHVTVDNNTSSSRVCSYYGMSACPNSRWNK